VPASLTPHVSHYNELRTLQKTKTGSHCPLDITVNGATAATLASSQVRAAEEHGGGAAR
jgi:hypothetical protein